MKPPASPTADISIKRHLRVARVATVVLVFGCGGWAWTTELSGAVLASGTVVVDANVKRVQHPHGGVVSAIYVRNGDRVRRGDVLIRLDPTVTRANLAIVTKSLDSLAVKRLRLESELAGAETFSLPPELAGRLSEPEMAVLVRAEEEVFKTRRIARFGLRAQLIERVAQSEQQILGIEGQVKAYADGMALIQQELSGVAGLYEKKLVTVNRLLELMRSETEMRGTHAQALAEIAQVKGRILEVNLQIMQIDEELRAEVSKELSEVQERAAELAERRIASLDQLERIDIRAPVDGIVHALETHTVGGVIEAAATLMQVVPNADKLSVEVRVEAQDRDQIHVGQEAVLRMSAFNQKTTPELAGSISTIAADLVQDPRTGMAYYPVRIALTAGEKERLGTIELTPGMPVESFVKTGYRSVLSYLGKPLIDYFTRGFRAE